MIPCLDFLMLQYDKYINRRRLIFTSVTSGMLVRLKKKVSINGYRRYQYEVRCLFFASDTSAVYSHASFSIFSICWSVLLSVWSGSFPSGISRFIMRPIISWDDVEGLLLIASIAFHWLSSLTCV